MSNKLEQLPDDLVSIGLDGPTLLAFKSHAALPVDSSWTESDALLQTYLLAGERQLDQLTGQPYRGRSFKYTFETFKWKRSLQTGAGWNVRGFPFACLEFPVRPVASSPEPTITWTDNAGNTGTWTAGTDFQIVGATDLKPLLYFPYNFQFPRTAQVPFPYVLNWKTAGVLQGDDAVAKVCIFEYAAAYYRKPEMAGQKLDYVSQVFDANLSLLLGSML